MRHDISRHRHAFRQRFRLPGKRIRPLLHEPLILQQPREPPAPLRIRFLHRARPVRHRIRRIGNVGIESLPLVFRRIKGKFCVAMKVKLAARHSITRRPRLPRLPLVRARLKRHRFLHRLRSLVLQPVGKPWRLNVLPEICARVATKIDVAKFCPVRARPSTVIPRPHRQIVVVLRIVLLEQLIHLHRTKEIFLVPPSRHVQVGHREHQILEVRRKRLLLPEFVIVRMRHEVIPCRQGPMKIQFIRIR